MVQRLFYPSFSSLRILLWITFFTFIWSRIPPAKPCTPWRDWRRWPSSRTLQCPRPSYALVRSEHQLTRALDHIAIMPGIVFFTLANQSLRDKLVLRCTDIGTRAIDVLEARCWRCASSWARAETHKVGRQHQVDQRYLERIEV